MSGFPSVNEQALHLVARELSATLNDVRVALEAAAETPADKSHVAKAAELMRAARGVLRVVEVYGAALLAEEMEHTSRWLAGSETDARQFVDGLDALMRASVQLPTYLERVLGGGRDLALVLLPLLNDLRAVRGAPLLSEGTLLSLNLSSEQAPAARETAAPVAKLTVAQWARRLRPRFQAGLLGLIRGEGEHRGLNVLAEVANRMESVATTAPLYQLWWVTGALVDALRDGGLEASITVKRLLGHVDRELKRLYGAGEEAYAGTPPIELLNNLLFYVARATVRSERIDAVRSSFRLGELLPIDESVEQERESLSAPSVRLMRTVAAAIKEDLGRVKDALDLFTRKGGPPEELAPQLDLLKKIGDTLAVLGLGSVREQVQGELSRLSDIITRRASAEQDTLIAIAATLIGVEDGLDDALVRLIMPPGAPAPGAETDPDFRQVTESVLRECIVNLARIKELLGQALDPTSEAGGLDAAPALARGITAGLLLLGRNRAMEVMRRIGDHVSALLGPGSLSRNDEYIDRLADAIVGIEYYMETLQAGRGDPWYMLDNAERCLAALDAMRAAAPGAAARPAAPAPPAPAPRPEPAAEGTQRRPAVDPELLTLFIEEAGEEIATIGRLFPLWAENPSDRESLMRVRRAFHTLKGSGRVVGARRIGDFAWAVENLLNRVIDGTLERSSAMLATLREAIALLPALVGELGGRSDDVAGLEEVAARLDAHATGQVAAAAKAHAAAAAPAPEPTLVLQQLGVFAETKRIDLNELAGTQAPDPGVTAGPAPDAEPPADDAWLGRPAAYAEGGDTSLQEIYQKEVQSHLEVIRTYLRHAWLAVGTHRVTEDLYRACHTLRGASRTAAIRHSVRLAEPLHRWLRRMFDHDAAFDEAGLAVLADSVVGFEDVLAAVHEDTAHFTNLDRLVRRIEQQDAALEKRLAEEPAPLSVSQEIAVAPAAPPPAPAPEPPPPEPPRLSIGTLLPARGNDVAVERDVHGVLPRIPATTGIEGRPPYLASAEAPAPDALAPSQSPEAQDVGAAGGGEDYDPEVASIFGEEATELLESADAAAGALKSEGGSGERITELKRVLHTLKGGARMAGISAMGDLSHELESLVIQFGERPARIDDRILEVVQASLDELARMRDYVGAGRPVPPARDLITRIRLVAKGGAPAAAGPPVPAPVVAPAAAPVQAAPEPHELPPAAASESAPTPAPEPEERAAAAPAGPPTRDATADRGEVARVDADLLDSMLNVAGEVSIYRARLEQQVSSIDFNLAELGRVVQRLKDQLRKLEIETEAQILHRHVDSGTRRDDFDPLELDRYSSIQQYSRALGETSSDVASVQGLLATQTREVQNLLHAAGTRSFPSCRAGSCARAWSRSSATCSALRASRARPRPKPARKCEVRIGGAAGELDRQVLERMLAPFEHMLRNAIVHGIELPEARRAAGKDETGRHRRGAETRGIRGRHHRRRRRRRRQPEAGARPGGHAGAHHAEAGALRRAGAAAHPRARILDRGQDHAVRRTRRRHGRGRDRDQEARGLALYRDLGRQGHPLHGAAAVHARDQPGAHHARRRRAVRAAAADRRGRGARAARRSAAPPRRGIRGLRVRRAEVPLPAPRRFRRRHAIRGAGPRRRRAGGPGTRRRALDRDRDRRADRQPRDRREDGGPADLRHPRHFRGDHPRRRPNLHHPRHRRAGAFRMAAQAGRGRAHPGGACAAGGPAHLRAGGR